MAISAQDVNKLRKATGAGMMDCKKALTETNGDFEAAIDLLRKKGQKVSAKRADRETSEGAVFVKADGSKGTLIALNCETDFVAKNDEFVNLGNSILDVAVTKGAGSIEALSAEALSDGRAISEHITDMIGKIGEKIEITSLSSIEADRVVPYIHSNNKLGVLVGLKGAASDEAAEIGKDVAMQIAAMNPVSVDKSGVDQETIDRELAIGKEQALAEGKPENIVEKIAQGKLNKFFKENTLLAQSFVKDSSKTVEQVLKDVDSNLTVAEFKRVAVG